MCKSSQAGINLLNTKIQFVCQMIKNNMKGCGRQYTIKHYITIFKVISKNDTCDDADTTCAPHNLQNTFLCSALVIVGQIILFVHDFSLLTIRCHSWLMMETRTKIKLIVMDILYTKSTCKLFFCTFYTVLRENNVAMMLKTFGDVSRLSSPKKIICKSLQLLQHYKYWHSWKDYYVAFFQNQYYLQLQYTFMFASAFIQSQSKV